MGVAGPVKNAAFGLCLILCLGFCFLVWFATRQIAAPTASHPQFGVMQWLAKLNVKFVYSFVYYILAYIIVNKPQLQRLWPWPFVSISLLEQQSIDDRNAVFDQQENRTAGSFVVTSMFWWVSRLCVGWGSSPHSNVQPDSPYLDLCLCCRPVLPSCVAVLWFLSAFLSHEHAISQAFSSVSNCFCRNVHSET